VIPEDPQKGFFGTCRGITPDFFFMAIPKEPIEAKAGLLEYNTTLKSFRTKPMSTAQILLTNDDGIDSPGLWAAAQALSQLGYVHVVAPRQQFSGAGRSKPIDSDGIIQIKTVSVNGQSWQVYAVGGTPAQTVQHALLEVLPEPPALIVAGINYGENAGVGITISGTVGAALEGAAHGIPSLAISLETRQEDHLSYSTMVDFSAAAHFAAYFGRLLMNRRFPLDVDVLKVDVPSDATLQTPWTVTHLSHRQYYEPVLPERSSWDEPGLIGYRLAADPRDDIQDTDVYALRVRRMVTVTPLSLDLTSRVDLNELEKILRQNPPPD
jgi:5'-nucleotidase